MIFSFTFFTSFALLSSAAAQGVVHQVTVGNNTGGTIYNPTNINAAIGDIVSFTFYPKNHTVTQSTFAEPCTPSSGGFDSGFHPVAIGTNESFPTWNITVNDTKPIWVHCQQDANTAASHCGKGMVFAINPGAPGSNNSFAEFQTAALAIGAQLAANSTNSTSSTTPDSSKGNKTTTTGTAATPSGSSSSKANEGISLSVNGAVFMFMASVGLMFGFLV
ncbi:Cupredoxin [Russula compacta]|nr:Cupredoxin [Russula compacta]